MKKRQGGAILIASIVLFLAAAVTVFGQASSTLLPASDGNYKQFRPKSGTTHYTMVDESSCNGKTDYNYTSTVGHRDSYGIDISSVPDGATINSIQITPCASANKNGSSVMNVFYRWNGADSSDAGNYSVNGTTPTLRSATSFNNLSLVKGSISSLEIGAVLTSGSKGLRLGQIAAVIDYTPLADPSNLLSSVDGKTVYLSWADNSSNEIGFSIERGLDGVSFSQIATATSTSYADNFAEYGMTYYYRVSSYNDGGVSGYSNTASASTLSLPVAPSDLTAVASLSDVNLSWTDNSFDEIGFYVSRSVNGVDFYDIGFASSGMEYFTDQNLPDGTYYYRVRARNVAGDSENSDIATVVVATIPSAPSNFEGYASSTSIFLSWTDNSFNENGFMVQASSNGLDYYWNWAVPANQNYYVGNGLPGTFYYRVYAFNEVGSSTYSNVISLTR